MRHVHAARDTTRFDTLDGLRGAAAACVVLLHCEPWIGRQVNFGHLAVDFFFCLSGFVIAHTYADRLRTGLSVGAFMAGRVRRLYPLYGLGCLVGLGAILRGPELAGVRIDDARAVATLIVTASLVLPFPTGSPATSLWVLNPASWSLLLEFVVNAIYAAGLRRVGDLGLLGVSAAGLAALCWIMATWETMEVGFNLATLHGGAVRVLYAFPLGVLVGRLHAAGRFASVPALHPIVPLGLLLEAMFFPALTDRRVVEIVVLVLVVPGILVLGLRSRCEGAWRSACRWSGRVSYPLYVLHAPIFLAFAGAASNLEPGSGRAWATAITAMTVAFAAAVLAKDVAGLPGGIGRRPSPVG